MATQEIIDQIAASLAIISGQFTKGFDEVRAKIAELEAQIAAGDPADFTALTATIDALADQAAALDDVVPDE